MSLQQIKNPNRKQKWVLGGGRRGRRSGRLEFFTKNPHLKYFFWGEGGQGEGGTFFFRDGEWEEVAGEGGTRVSEFF